MKYYWRHLLCKIRFHGYRGYVRTLVLGHATTETGYDPQSYMALYCTHCRLWT